MLVRFAETLKWPCIACLSLIQYIPLQWQAPLRGAGDKYEVESYQPSETKTCLEVENA